MNARPDYKTIGIAIDRRRLSDISHVYFVRVGNSAKMHCVSEHDAIVLAEKIQSAILEHTTENPGVIYGF